MVDESDVCTAVCRVLVLPYRYPYGNGGNTCRATGAEGAAGSDKRHTSKVQYGYPDGIYTCTYIHTYEFESMI